jgi:hypothetical protein
VRAALLPIAVHSADEGSAYLSDGLAEMLTARLEQTNGVSVVRLAGDVKPTTDVEKAVAAGKAAGADYVIYGAFTQFGAGASLDIQCAAVNGPADGDGERSRRIFVQSGTLGEIIPKLDGVSEKIARYMTSGGSDAAAVAGAPVADDGAALGEIKRRLDALERTVYTQPEKRAEAARAGGAPTAKPPAKR